ncbi:Arrestin domain-containing protein 3 [Channa argus]|uniref:Arrestin domain-containing protein 3 n=1 Tax=Channa argus TaxID=215402 RepID=A0A6G1Q117_CHAAH|nr:Arrestin domain-containing protein 3 [Channa argus]
MSPIKNICLTYEPLNEEGTFSEGDFLYGTVTFTLTKDTKVKTVLVKAKGEANVHWTEKSGNDERSYSARKRYFKVKENFVGESAQDSKETVSCQIKIPVDAIYTLYNCDIISVDYFLKVYLDISFAIDPVVLFPLVIVPPSLAASQADEAVGPYPAGAVGAPSYSDLPPPAFPVGPYPAPTGSGTYGYPAPGPNQHMDISGYKNQWAQQATPYGFSTTAFTAPSVQVPAPTVPPLFQQGEEPPSYMSLFPTSQDNLSSSESNYKS